MSEGIKLSVEDAINGLKHLADDHECCRVFSEAIIDLLSGIESENAALRAELLKKVAPMTPKEIAQFLWTFSELRHGLFTPHQFMQTVETVLTAKFKEIQG